nr:MAG TPA: hypothetical protein [Caudoviricetes sp.]
MGEYKPSHVTLYQIIHLTSSIYSLFMSRARHNKSRPRKTTKM